MNIRPISCCRSYPSSHRSFRWGTESAKAVEQVEQLVACEATDHVTLAWHYRQHDVGADRRQRNPIRTYYLSNPLRKRATAKPPLSVLGWLEN